MARRLALSACGLIAALPAAQADQPLWEAGLGLGALRLPHYRGSDQDRNWLLPVPYFVYRGEFLRADREGARAVLVERERFDIDLSLAASPPANSDDNRAREGMPSLAAAIEAGPTVNYTLARGRLWKLQARVPVRASFTLESRPEAIGWQAAPSINFDVQRGGWNIGVLAGPLFGSRRLNGYYYDVAPQFATASRPAYRAPAGYAGWRALMGTSRRIGDFWVGAFAGADSVRGARFDDSPLVRRRETLSFGVAVSWVFAASSQRVPDED